MRFSVLVMLFLCVAILPKDRARGQQVSGEQGFSEPEYPSPVEIGKDQFRARARKAAHEKGSDQALYGSVGSIDRRYARNIPPDDGPSAWSGTAWRGERVSAQIVLWTAAGAKAVRYHATPLRTKQGAEIEASRVNLRFVRYVLADDEWPNCDTPPRVPLVHMPDVLDPADQLDLPALSTRPLWVSVDVPVSATPGHYRGQVVVSSQESRSLSFDINLEVLPMTLPPPSQWRFHLDLWQNPYAVARYHQVHRGRNSTGVGWSLCFCCWPMPARSASLPRSWKDRGAIRATIPMIQ